MRIAPVALCVLLALSGTGAILSAPTAHATASSVDGYTLSKVALPGFAYLYPYLYNYRDQYPVLGWSGQCAGGILYITNLSRLACFEPANGTAWNVSAPLTLLYQRTVGIEAQVDNEFQLDYPYDVALLYGNRTTSAGPVTVETVNLSTGAVAIADTPVPMANSIQCDYVGAGLVVTLNATGSNGAPEITNLSNGTSWRSGLAVGVAANNAYWVSGLRAFIDVAGTHLAELKLTNAGKSIRNVGNAWVNRTGLSSVTAVNGIAYDAATGRLAVDLATNLGTVRGVVKLTGGLLTPAGAYTLTTTAPLYLQRYAYTSTYDWALNGTTTLLVDPFTNATLPAPNLLGRTNGSGANSNYEWTDPGTTSRYLSLNGSLVGAATLRPNEFVYAQIPPPPPIGAGGVVVQIGTLVLVVAIPSLVVVEVLYGMSARRRRRGPGPP
jgi:hypothetical protein